MSDLEDFFDDELYKKQVDEINAHYTKRKAEIEKESAERMKAIDKKYNRIQFGIFIGLAVLVVFTLWFEQYAEQKQSDYLKTVSCSELANKKMSEVPLRCVKEYVK